MRHLLYLVFAVLFLVNPANRVAAQCAGSDLRASLAPAEAAELERRVSATPHSEGIHWIATRGEQVLHLVGTVHVGEPRLAPMAEALAPVLREARALFVEATGADQKRIRQAAIDRPELLFITSGPTLPELMDEDAWQRLAEAARDRGIPAFMAAKFQPWYLSMMLAMPGCVVQQMRSQSPGLDARLIMRAEAHGVPQIALEPHDKVFELMARAPIEEQISFLELGVLPESVAEDGFATLLASYFEDRTAEILELNRIVARRHLDLPAAEIDRLMDEMLEAVLYERNRAWIPVLLEAPEGVSMAAMGAAHLPGEEGVLSLLAEQGFRLERQPLPGFD